jgi:hypothetical protein
MADIPQDPKSWLKTQEGPDSLHTYQLFAEAKDNPDIFKQFYAEGRTALQAENYWKHLDPSDNSWGKYGYLRDAPTLTGDDLPPSLRPQRTPTPATAPPPLPSLPGAPTPAFQLSTTNTPPGGGGIKGYGGGTQVDARAFMSFLGSSVKSLLSGR